MTRLPSADADSADDQFVCSTCEVSVSLGQLELSQVQVPLRDKHFRASRRRIKQRPSTTRVTVDGWTLTLTSTSTLSALSPG
jgi:hypothetical protein